MLKVISKKSAFLLKSKLKFDAMIPSSACIIFFFKAPVEGFVKTRLNDRLDTADTLKIYRAFLFDMLNTLTESGQDIRICFDPPGEKQLVIEMLGEQLGEFENQYQLYTQNGKDLGERMNNAFLEAFAEGYKKAILIGSDLPDLPADIIESALAYLNSSPAVIGPSTDGGYYLIGFRSDEYLAAAFQNFTWSTPKVLEHTLERFQENNLQVRLLPEWHDIDTGEDLKELADRISEQPGRIPHTRKVLEQCGFVKKWKR